MSISIRPFNSADYERIAEINNSAYSDDEGKPTFPKSAAQFREGDDERPDYIKFARWVAEVGGRVVGVGEYDQAARRYDPRKFFVDVFVDPAYHRQGIGTALYNQVDTALRKLNPLSGRGMVREDLPHSFQFLGKRGWNEVQRTWESQLDLAAVDVAPLMESIQPLQQYGVTITTLSELEADPQHRNDVYAKLHDLVWQIRQDMPDVDAPTRETFEQFLEWRLQNPRLLRNAYFVAVHNGAYIGVSNYNRDDDDSTLLHTDTTGVLRTYRRQGIALALKVMGLVYGKGNGYTRILTNNESSNRAMLAINERLGFVKSPAWIDLVKVYGGEQ
jgi:GNAT superfamily N-acetyltransferase